MVYSNYSISFEWGPVDVSIQNKGPEIYGVKIMSITLIASDTVKHYDIGVHILSILSNKKYVIGLLRVQQLIKNNP